MPNRKSSRRSRRNGSGLAGKLYSPFEQFFKATGNSAKDVGHGVGNVANKVVGTVGRVGKRYANGLNRTIRTVTSRKNRRGSTRKGSRRHGRR